MYKAEHIRVKNPLTTRDHLFSVTDPVFYDMFYELAQLGLKDKMMLEIETFAANILFNLPVKEISCPRRQNLLWSKMSFELYRLHWSERSILLPCICLWTSQWRSSPSLPSLPLFLRTPPFAHCA
jgi:hypothetical protein